MALPPIDPCAIILAKIKVVKDQNPGRGGKRNAAVEFGLELLEELLEEMKAAFQAVPVMVVDQSPLGHEQRSAD